MHSNAFEVAGGTLALTNVTAVGGDREPVLQKGGVVTVVNSILWDNASETGVSFDVAADTDLDGLPRLRNGKVDLGCYSFNAPGLLLMLK